MGDIEKIPHRTMACRLLGYGLGVLKTITRLLELGLDFCATHILSLLEAIDPTLTRHLVRHERKMKKMLGLG